MPGHAKTQKGKHDGPRLFYDVQIDLHGLFAEEALQTLEKAIYSCPNSSILVIHGRGGGILRQTVRNALKTNKYPIRGFVPGEDINAPGLDGVTIVYT